MDMGWTDLDVDRSMDVHMDINMQRDMLTLT